ncbi:hypothetical protein SEMRO_754_G197530.1 [Seminavis robusta]|uniref:Uncharacterized protein n=1 Tax=Seminavis robusta TaxID=568900 RepID=A0A9N8HKG1_9STRA|nr:hypothetical protein SEMRO_754_G197530.1 [Seminavis robusta]|eukprot:Sro754_g197530.1 n/a (431) ;mRNA; r:35187-36643
MWLLHIDDDQENRVPATVQVSSNRRKKSPRSPQNSFEDLVTMGNTRNSSKKRAARDKQAQKMAKKARSKENPTQEAQGDSKPAAKDTTFTFAQVAQLVKSGGQLAQKKETQANIEDFVKQEYWRRVKFITNDAGAIKGCHAYLNHHQKLMGDDDAAERHAFCVLYKDHFVDCLNKQRGYAQNRVRDACSQWMQAHNGQMPPKDGLSALLSRTWNPPAPLADNATDDQKKKWEAEWDLAIWYWDSLLAKATGNSQHWNEGIRYYKTISTACKPLDPNYLFMHTTTEAIALTFVRNNYRKWAAMEALKRANAGKKIKIMNGAAPTDVGNDPVVQGTFVTVYEDNGNKLARETPQSSAMEEAILAQLHNVHGLFAESQEEERRMKRRKSSIIDSAFMEEISGMESSDDETEAADEDQQGGGSDDDESSCALAV